jgi:hypothetical protein
MHLLGNTLPPGRPDLIEGPGDHGIGVRGLVHPEVEYEPGIGFEAGSDAPRSQLRDRLLRLPDAAQQHLAPPLVRGHAPRLLAADSIAVGASMSHPATWSCRTDARLRPSDRLASYDVALSRKGLLD